MHRNYWLLAVLFGSAVVGAGCAGSKTYTEEDKTLLRKVRSVQVDIGSDYRNVPTGTDGISEAVERFISDKMRQAGLAVAAKNQPADVSLSAYIVFVSLTPVGTPPAGFNKDARYMSLTLTLKHPNFGQLARYTNLVEPPYSPNFAEHDNIKWLDKNILINLYKLTPARPLRETCTQKLAYRDIVPSTRKELMVGVHVSPHGSVINTEILRSTGTEPLDQRGTEYIKSCQYSPQLIDGQPSMENGYTVDRLVFLPS